MSESVKEMVMSLLRDLKYSETRMPYTYHHDLMREKFSRFESRAEVAHYFEDVDDDHLYSIAYLYVLKQQCPLHVLKICSDMYGEWADLIIGIAEEKIKAVSERLIIDEAFKDHRNSKNI